ncbi:hypothetical protein [Flavobacterium sp.]|uniref:hypothetical protein n=1 Tax=Flavobacterium sp. TaxID=239 RepID=UPI004048B9C2
MKNFFLIDIVTLFKKQEIYPEQDSINIKKIFINLIIFVFFIMFLNILNVLILLLLGYKSPPNFNNNDEILPYEIILIAPFVEEMFFRFPLKKGMKNLYVFLVFIILFLSMKFDIINKIYIYVSFLFLLTYIVIQSKKRNLDKNNYSNGITLYLTILLSIIFGLFHVVNFDTAGDMINSYLLIFSISKIFTGISLSVIRLKYGILASFFFHLIFNLIIYLIQ